MKFLTRWARIYCTAGAILVLMLGQGPEAQAQGFSYTTNNATITITGYTGPGGAVTIPSAISNLPVTSIAGGAFDVFIGNTGPASVTIPDSVTYLGSHVFNECLSLTNISIGSGVTNIGTPFFSFCGQLSAITVAAPNAFYMSQDGVLFNKSGTALLQYPPGKAGTFEIPATVSVIWNYAFNASGRLTSVTIPNTVTAIGDYAFSESGLTNVTLPNSITAVGNSVFFSCISLTNVVIPNSVTSIGDLAFEACSSLTSITIPNSVTIIGNQAFDICTSLLRVAIPNSVGSIGDLAFYSCSSLTNITIGYSVTNIGSRAFHNCASLEGVYFLGNAPTPGANVFEFDGGLTAYYLPGATGWGATFGGVPAILWNPWVMTSDARFGVRTNLFGFNITGTTDIPLVIEASTNFAKGSWIPLQSCMLTNGSLYFSDAQWTNYRGRFYRIRSP